MSLKIECFKKSLKDDFSDIGIVGLVFAIIAIIIYALWYFSGYIFDFLKYICNLISGCIWSIFNIVGSIYAICTPVNVFIFSETIVTLFMLGCIVASFKEDIKTKDTTLTHLFGSISMLYVCFGAYWAFSFMISQPHMLFDGIMSKAGDPLPDVGLILGGFIILNVILQPVCIALKRCWD